MPTPRKDPPPTEATTTRSRQFTRLAKKHFGEAWVDSVSDYLDISRRSVYRYADGTTLVPKAVILALQAYVPPGMRKAA